MIAIDTNLLIYAHHGSAPNHQVALDVLQPVFEGTSAWALPWPCLHEFISVATHPSIYKPASTLAEALGFVDSLLSSPQLHSNGDHVVNGVRVELGASTLECVRLVAALNAPARRHVTPLQRSTFRRIDRPLQSGALMVANFGRVASRPGQ